MNTNTKLPEYNGYTVDYRLQQFRRCASGWYNGGVIEFIEFDSEEGDRILSEMINAGVADLDKIKI